MEQLTIIPEIVIYNVVNSMLNYIRTDYAGQNDKDNSFLRRVMFGNVIEKYDFITQAEAIFLADIDDPRAISVNMMFNMQKEGVPAIHIMLPGESPQTGGNGMGMDAGFRPSINQDFVLDGDDNVITEGTSTDVFTRRYQSTLNLVITSDNSNEVVLIYNMLKALFTAYSPQMNLLGLENVSIGGNDLQIKNDLIPKNIFLRSINISLQYDTSVPNVIVDPIFLDFMARGTAVISN